MGRHSNYVYEEEDPRLRPLSKREREIVNYIAAGFESKVIAQLLGRSLQTIKNHITNAMSKTNTRSRTQLTTYAIREGLIPIKKWED